MFLKRAVDLMIPLEKYPHLTHWFTIRQAVLEMDRAVIEVNGRTSLPRALLVFDEQYKLLGIVRRRDILRAFKQTLVGHETPGKSRKTSPEEHQVQKLAELKRQAELPISDVMTPLKVMVNHDDDIIKIIAVIDEFNLSLVPVVQENRVIGVVRSVDVFHEISLMLV